jgi:hypothetical protein
VQFDNSTVLANEDVGLEISMTTTVPIGANHNISLALSGFTSNVTDLEFEVMTFTKDHAFFLNTLPPMPSPVLIGCIDPATRCVLHAANLISELQAAQFNMFHK